MWWNGRFTLWMCNKFEATVWCCYNNMESNVWGMFTATCWIEAMKNENSLKAKMSPAEYYYTVCDKLSSENRWSPLNFVQKSLIKLCPFKMYVDVTVTYRVDIQSTSKTSGRCSHCINFTWHFMTLHNLPISRQTPSHPGLSCPHQHWAAFAPMSSSVELVRL